MPKADTACPSACKSVNVHLPQIQALTSIKRFGITDANTKESGMIEVSRTNSEQ